MIVEIVLVMMGVRKMTVQYEVLANCSSSFGMPNAMMLEREIAMQTARLVEMPNPYWMMCSGILSSMIFGAADMPNPAPKPIKTRPTLINQMSLMTHRLEPRMTIRLPPMITLRRLFAIRGPLMRQPTASPIMPNVLSCER